METIILGGLAVGIVSGLIGIWVATQKRRSPIEGWWAGMLLGPFGVLLVALFPAGPIRETKPAPPRPRAALKPLREVDRN